MADWSQPTTTSNYATGVLQSIDGRLNDAATFFASGPTNQPVGSKRYVEASNKFQRWDGANWNDLNLSIAGGGTGAGDAATARTNLGLGTIATQNSNAVAITGGSISSSVLSGLVPTANLGTGSANNTTFLRGDQSWQPISSFSPGFIVAYGGSSAPSGWLLCDGSAVSRTTYASLFATIGTTFGAGDGSTTFNVPDLRQRFPLGKAASGTGSVLGSTGGAIDHTHSSASHSHTMGNHTHTLGNHTHFVPSFTFNLVNPALSTDGSHTHTFSTSSAGPSSAPNLAYTPGSSNVPLPTNTHTHSVSGTTDSNGSHTHSITDSRNSQFTTNGPSTNTSDGPSTNSTDATTPGNTGTNNPPFVVVNFIIKT